MTKYYCDLCGKEITGYSGNSKPGFSDIGSEISPTFLPMGLQMVHSSCREELRAEFRITVEALRRKLRNDTQS